MSEADKKQEVIVICKLCKHPFLPRCRCVSSKCWNSDCNSPDKHSSCIECTGIYKFAGANRSNISFCRRGDYCQQHYYEMVSKMTMLNKDKRNRKRGCISWGCVNKSAQCQMPYCDRPMICFNAYRCVKCQLSSLCYEELRYFDTIDISKKKRVTWYDPLALPIADDQKEPNFSFLSTQPPIFKKPVGKPIETGAKLSHTKVDTVYCNNNINGVDQKESTIDIIGDYKRQKINCAN